MSDGQERELIEFIVARAGEGAPEITPDTQLFREKVLDSMNILDLIGYVEVHLGRRLSDDELVMSSFESVRAITRAFFVED
ncbi:MAG: acyl carrier protein [Chloroflexota bacterium]|nr:acyl carrier protein [Chloroflexota bacterium]